MIGDALIYPFRGSGIFILIVGTLIGLFLQLISVVPILGLLAMVFFYAYFAAYYFQLLQKTATGSDSEPDWPDVSDFFEDLIRPILMVIGVLIIANIPWALAIAFLGQDSAVAWIAQGVGMFYFPMALLAVVILGHLGGANPLLVIPSIFDNLGSYATVAGIAISLPFLINLIIGSMESSPFLQWGLSTLLTLYLITAHARLLGLFYRQKQEDLAWL